MIPAGVDPAILEPVTARAWRAALTTRLGDWRLHASLGVSNRINACWTMGESGLAADAAVDRVEAWYASQGLPARFKLVDGRQAADLASALEAKGYGPGAATLVMTAIAAGASRADIELLTDPDPRFSGVFAQTAHDPLDARERLDALRRTPQPRTFAIADLDGAPAAIGACAIEPPWVGLFAMRTVSSARRRGLAGRILEALLERGRELGAAAAWLQVEADNAMAVRLYEKFGFRVAYAYRYWRRG